MRAFCQVVEIVGESIKHAVVAPGPIESIPGICLKVFDYQRPAVEYAKAVNALAARYRNPRGAAKGKRK